MKKLIQYYLLPVLCAVLIFTNVKTATAQGEWLHGHDKGIYSIGLGGTDGIEVGTGYNNVYGYGGVVGYGNLVSRPGLSINAAGEYKVYKWIGVGWESGLNVIPNRYGDILVHVSNPFVEIPFIAVGNFHILDATPASIKKKLDVYAGLTVGAGPAFYTKNQGGYVNNVFGMVHVGPHGGARYWFNDKMAVFAEFGWGATFINAGITL